MLELNKIYCMDALEGMQQIPDNFIDLTITSPPYFNLRLYSNDNREIGREQTEEEYIENLIRIFIELRRITKPDGGFYLNVGDLYTENGQLRLIPYKIAERMKQIGWILRSHVVWFKPMCMPSSTKNRFSNVWEPVFQFQKTDDYYFDLDSVRIPHKLTKGQLAKKLLRDSRLSDKSKIELQSDKSKYKKLMETNKEMDLPLKKQQYHEKGRNPGNVWKIQLESENFSHTARYPLKLCERPILAGCPKDGIVFDLFTGSGSTQVMAKMLGRRYLGFDINPEFVKIAIERLEKVEFGSELKKEESKLDKWFR